MATNAVAAQGTLLKVGDGGGTEVFTTVAEVMDITGPSYKASTEEVTSHDSGAWREHIATLLEIGEVTFDILYFSHTTQDQLRTDMFARTRRNFQINFAPLTPDEIHTFAAFITGFQMNAPVEGALRASLTLMGTGGPPTLS